eukprot:scaffold212203_cov33-Tisochrysis_lutea.AAC.5
MERAAPLTHCRALTTSTSPPSYSIFGLGAGALLVLIVGPRQPRLRASPTASIIKQLALSARLQRAGPHASPRFRCGVRAAPLDSLSLCLVLFLLIGVAPSAVAQSTTGSF